MTRAFPARFAQPSRVRFLDDAVASPGSAIIFRRTKPSAWNTVGADFNWCPGSETIPQCEKHAAPAVVMQGSDSTRPARPSFHRALSRPSAWHTTLYIESWNAGHHLLGWTRTMLWGGAHSVCFWLQFIQILESDMKAAKPPSHTRRTPTRQPVPPSQPASQSGSPPASQPASQMPESANSDQRPPGHGEL